MPTIKRATVVKLGMERGTGARYTVYRDILRHCFRVLPEGSHRVWHSVVE